MLAGATDGKEEATHIGNALLKMADKFSEHHGKLIQLYLYLSRVQWERGYQAEAFTSLDEALQHARALENLLDGEKH